MPASRRMRYLALASDYDGTLAHHGRLTTGTIDALERLIASGRKVLLVTGRELDDLQTVCSRLDLFACIVAENGALLYWPDTRREERLAPAADPEFVAKLRERGVGPISVGRSIVATREPHETAVLETIRKCGLELQVIFNKGAVMVLPAGVNKATGLNRALTELGLSRHNTAGIGDAENDHAFLSSCECGVAVANALPTVKETADLVTTGHHGEGVIEIVAAMLADDLASAEPRLTRHHLLLGTDPEGNEIRIPPYGTKVLLVGTSGSGKSTLATALLERLAENEYTYCVVDPEGDYDELPGAVVLGSPDRAASHEEILKLLAKPGESAIVNLIALKLEDRPAFFAQLLPRLIELRARTGRPHWLVVDEAHHMLPTEWQKSGAVLPERLHSSLQITVHPGLVARRNLEDVDTVIAVGDDPAHMFRDLAGAVGEKPPRVDKKPLRKGEAFVWFRGRSREAMRTRIVPGTVEHRRHTRKYAEGELGPDRSFYFRGPDGKLNLRAQNLILFLQLADGVDDDTWLHHLRARDYSAWMRDNVKDEALAERVARIEKRLADDPLASRREIRAAVEETYTLPAAVNDARSTGRAARAGLA
ncbi:MAG TPA: HAD-IIB family hydrolase [Steroidobacteraceae bacterium]|nr:HAD-IIB family hydrolase [Steroidobacteraceae bacterium]